MSNSNSLVSGLSSGFHQGVKTGMGFSPMYSGLRQGYINGICKHDKVQDPTIGLIANKKPLVFWLADYAVYSGTTLSTIYNLIPGGTALNIGSSPAYIDNGFLNTKSYIDYNSAADRIYTSATTLMSGKYEMSVVMLVKLTTTNGILFHKVDSTTINTIGDLNILSNGLGKIRVSLIGNPTSTSSVWDTYDATLEGSWVILTVKVDLRQTNGLGSELQIFINGTQNQTPVTTTFTTTGTSVFAADQLNFGNNTSATQAGSQIAGAFVCDYLLNSAEQQRIENFFRWYYGYRF